MAKGSAKGIGVHVGLNAVDPKHYQGWDGTLVACEADAEDMCSLAAARGFDAATLLTKKATRAALTGAIADAAKALKAGDIFFLSYSGHGGTVPDVNGDEEDAQDETWCLYDGELLDDELYALYGRFAPGVRVLVLSDSCHSGTVARAAFYSALRATGGLQAVAGAADGSGRGAVRFRSLPPEIALRTYRANREFYDGLQSARNRESRDTVRATVLLISGCQDNQESSDGDFNGLFTANLLRTWNGGRFRSGYRAFHKAIARRMPPIQTPNYYVVGAPNPAFERQRPFTIDAAARR